MKRYITIALLIALVFKAFGASDGAVQKHWFCNGHQYPYNMTMIGAIQIDGEEQQFEYVEIGAFCGEECRGSELLTYYPAADKYLVFLTVYGSNNDVITFRLYDHQTETELEVESLQDATFTANAIFGTPNEPYLFGFNSGLTMLTITANVLPEGSGYVNGNSTYSGTFSQGATCTLQATPSGNYQFQYWMKDGVQVSSSATYSFTVTEDANYSACFVLGTSINPHWTFNPYQYDHSMTMVGVVKIDGEEQRTPYLELGAFCGSECRGNTLMQYVPALDRYFAFLTVYGEDMNTINFKLYDHYYGYEIDRRAPLFAFVADTICGNPGDPYIFSFNSFLTIQATPNYTSAGTVSGAGNYYPGDLCTLIATPNNGYFFMHWIENDEVISTNVEYSFYVEDNRILRAVFCQELPELHITSMSHSNFVSTKTATVSWTVQNDGLAGTGSTSWVDRVFLSVGDHVTYGESGTYLLETFTSPATLGVGESYTQTQTVTIPEEINGPYYLFVITDAYDASTIYWENNQMVLPYNPPPYISARSSYNYSDVLEMSEYVNGNYYHDNFYVDTVDIAIPLLPELHVTSISHSDFVSSQTATVTWTVQNDGEASTGSSSWYDRLWLSPVNNVTYGATGTYLLGSFTCPATLGVGESYTQTQTVTIPEEIDGPYYLFVITDARDASTIFWENNQMVLPYTPPPYITAWSSYNYSYVLESSEYQIDKHYHDNFFIDTVDIAIPLLPELHVTSISHSDFVSSQTATVTWTVQNDGEASTGSSSWYDKVWLSPVNNVTSGATGTYLLGTFTCPAALGVGESYTQTKTVTIPEEINGPYYLFVITDAYDASTIYWENNQMVLPYNPPPYITARSSSYGSNVLEMSEYRINKLYHDNFFIDTVNIAIPLLPELHVTSISHSNFVSGHTATVTWTVQNDGEAGTDASTWNDLVWLSLENHVTAGAAGCYCLGNFNNFAALGAGESYTQTQTVTIPEEVNGPYYLFVITDAYDASTIYWENNQMVLPYNPPPYISARSSNNDSNVLELSEYQIDKHYHDNFFIDAVEVLLSPLPDLQVASIIAPDNFYSGTNVTVTATISNMGMAPTSVSHWTDALYISDSAAFGPNSQCIALASHNGYLNDGSSYQQTFNGTIPVTMFGSAYFYVQTDYYNQVYEHVMDNNNISRSEEVNIILTPPADLVPYLDSYTQNASTGVNYTVSFTVVNEGAGVPNYSSWYDHVYLSNNPDEIGDDAYLLTSIYHWGNLQPNAEYSRSWTGSLPNGIAAGTYYLYVYADATDNVFEYLYNDNNIVRSAPITVGIPDLQVIQINAPDTLVACYPMNISYVVKNNGNGAVENRNVINRIGLSTDVYLTDTTTISKRDLMLNLQPNETTTIMANTALPNVEEGTYHLFVMADAGNNLFELNENNNTYIKYPVFVEHQPLPDLKPLNLALPTTINAGTDINIEFDVTNIGELDVLDINCNISLYATNGVDSILCGMQTQTLPLPLGLMYTSIQVGDTIHYVRTVSVSSWVTSEYSTFLLVVDPQNTVVEMDETNNVVSESVTVINCPLPDLTISNISPAAGFQSGVANVINVTVANNGEAALENETLSFAVVAYQDDDTIVCPVQTQPFSGTNIAVNGNQVFTVSVFLPPMILGDNPNIKFTVDPNETIHELNHTNNTTTYTGTVLSYPFDLQVLSMNVPSDILAGREYTISWTVKNNGTCPSATIPMYVNNEGQYVMVNGNYLPTPWIDKVFISDDNIVDEDDVELISFNRTMVLNPDATYTATQTFVVPFTEVGAKQILCVADASINTYDNNGNNNRAAQAVNVSYGPLPDLNISAIDMEDIIESGASYWINYTVTNEGEESTLVDAWTDAFYLSNNATNLTNAYSLGSKIHNGLLPPSESYTDSIELIIPNGIYGEYYFISFTDATSLVFEDENEDNNMVSTSVTLITPLPCDLLVSDLGFPAEAQSGEEIEVSWQLSNLGANPASGRIREAVYLSADDVWSGDDIMLGSTEQYINIPTNGMMARQLSMPIQGVTEGNYYVIVRSNIQHALNEVTYENNVIVSLTPLSVTYPVLAIGSSVNQTMSNDQYIYYRIDVGDEYEGQTLSCSLTTSSTLILNKLYLSYEGVPTLASFDFGASTPYEQELEILIPSLNRGRYYLLATGTESTGVTQSITIAASIVNFEILHVDTDHGSNAGSITTQIIGAKFDSIMDFRLVQGNQYLPAEKVFYSNSTESYATFNLKDMPAGDYGMAAELPGGIITIKNQAFVVEEGLPAELALNIIAPSGVRRGSKFTVNIEYGNYGSTDLNVSGFVVISNFPIAFQSDSLSLNQHELTFMTDEGQGNPDVIRPGHLASKTIFVYANIEGNISIKVYPIRRHY